MKKQKRFYVCYHDRYWSLSKQMYLRFLQEAAACTTWNLDTDYESKIIIQPPANTKPIDVTQFSREDFLEEIKHFNQTGEQSGKKGVSA